MGTIHLKTEIPGPKSKAPAIRREGGLPRGLGHATPVYVAKAEGALLEDVDGNRFIDFTGGIGCVNVGHRAPEVVGAVKQQLDQCLHGSEEVTPYEGYVRVAERNDLSYGVACTLT